MAEEQQAATTDLLQLTAGIVAAHVEHNSVHAADLPTLIKAVHGALANLGTPEAQTEPEKPVGAVSARKSLADPNRILSMIDGKAYTTLKRHLGLHGYTPESYRETFGLPRDYPMVAAAFSERRRAIAKEIGLGARRAEQAVAPALKQVKRGAKAAAEVVSNAAEPVEKVVRRGRAKAADALASARKHLPG